MQTIQSTAKPFRYLPKVGPAPTHLSATRVLVGHVDPAPFIPYVEGSPRMVRLDAKVMHESNNCLDLDLDVSMFMEHLLQRSEMWHGLLTELQAVGGPDVLKCADMNYACINTAVPFHVDMPLHNHIFGAFFIEGVTRNLRFSEMDINIEAKPGTLVLFDPAQPHGLVTLGDNEFIEENYGKRERIRMFSLCLPKSTELCAALGIEEYSPFTHAGLPHTMPGYAPDRRTGAIPFHAPIDEWA